jgi:eukaryotic-like serine/threonine-protein kinase
MQRKYAQAEPLYAGVLEIKRRVPGPQHSESLDGMVSLGEVHLMQHDFVRAETVCREYLTILEEKSPDDWRRYYGQALLGASLAGQKRYVEAEPLLVHGHQGIGQRKATIPPGYRQLVTQAGERIVQLYQRWGKPEKAAEWRAKLEMK